MRRLVLLLPVLVALQVGVQPALAWAWPVDGPVLRPFVLGDDPYAGGQHRGVDIGAPAGTPVRAPAAGTVSFAGTVPTGGKTITIRTADGYAVTLLHLGSISVRAGARGGRGRRRRRRSARAATSSRPVRLSRASAGRRARRLRRSARAPAPVAPAPAPRRARARPIRCPYPDAAHGSGSRHHRHAVSGTGWPVEAPSVEPGARRRGRARSRRPSEVRHRADGRSVGSPAHAQSRAAAEALAEPGCHSQHATVLRSAPGPATAVAAAADAGPAPRLDGGRTGGAARARRRSALGLARRRRELGDAGAAHGPSPVLAAGSCGARRRRRPSAAWTGG